MGYRLRVLRRGNAVAVRLSIVVAAAFALLSFSTPAFASTSIRYGVHDDAWLRYGPRTLKERLAPLQSLGVDLVRVNVYRSEVEAHEGVFNCSACDRGSKGLDTRGTAPIR